MTNVFIIYFNDLVENLKLKVLENLLNHPFQPEDPSFKTILKYQSHPSITAIQLKPFY